MLYYTAIQAYELSALYKPYTGKPYIRLIYRNHNYRKCDHSLNLYLWHRIQLAGLVCLLHINDPSHLCVVYIGQIVHMLYSDYTTSIAWSNYPVFTAVLHELHRISCPEQAGRR